MNSMCFYHENTPLVEMLVIYRAKAHFQEESLNKVPDLCSKSYLRKASLTCPISDFT